MILCGRSFFLSKPRTLCILSCWAHECLLAKPNRGQLPRLGYEAEVGQACLFRECHRPDNFLSPAVSVLLEAPCGLACHNQHAASNTQSWPCLSPTSNPALAPAKLFDLLTELTSITSLHNLEPTHMEPLWGPCCICLLSLLSGLRSDSLTQKPSSNDGEAWRRERTGFGRQDRQCKRVVKSIGFSVSPSLVTPQLRDFGQASGPQFSHLLNGKKNETFLLGCQRVQWANVLKRPNFVLKGENQQFRLAVAVCQPLLS